MDVAKDHIIHSQGGRVGAGVTSRENAQRIGRQAFTTKNDNGIVLHFHGGLVTRSYAEADIAARLALRYGGAGTYPIFSIWQSGFIETIRNNLEDILHDKVFQELLKKASEWVLRKGSGNIATRGGAGEAIDADRLRADYDRWFDGQAEQAPVKDVPTQKIIYKSASLDEDELAQQIADEIELDPVFEATMAGLAVADNRISANKTKGAGIAPLSVKVLVDQKALDELFPAQPYVTKGGISWILVAKFVAKVVVAVVGRYQRKSDHGAYTTIVEEVLRAAYLDKVGQVIWNQMKKDAGIDAFDGEDGVGEVVLRAWKQCIDDGLPPPRITLVGHSTGAVYINGWLERSAALTPALKYDLVLLAPACRTEGFIDVLQRHRARISNFRLFGMKDSGEQLDRLVPIIYPRSLLYFVSGVVEGDVDVPLLGMQRFLLNGDVYQDGYMAELRQFLDHPTRAVWSLAAGGLGLGSDSAKHGDFDNDEATIRSIEHLITSGY